MCIPALWHKNSQSAGVVQVVVVVVVVVVIGIVTVVIPGLPHKLLRSRTQIDTVSRDQRSVFMCVITTSPKRRFSYHAVPANSTTTVTRSGFLSIWAI